jgi:hypothetical protein
VSSPPRDVRQDPLCLKDPSGWFAAGASSRQALRILSDGAFKLFFYLCLEADRRTGRLEATQAELAQAIRKSRRIVGKYVEELESKEVCTVRSGSNQHARTCFEIRDKYWPYHRMKEAADSKVLLDDAYVSAIKSRFLALGCTVGKFSAHDAQLAQDLKRRGVSLETVRDALNMGAARKYVSWLNGGSPQPIGSLAYFSALVSEMQGQTLPAGYREYLQEKVVKLARTWAKESSNKPESGGYADIARTKIVQ